MVKSKKNPLLTGLLNMLVPGSFHVYVKREWRKFIVTFIGMELLLALMIWIGTSLQGSHSFDVPQGLCPGGLALIVLVPLFLTGRNAAVEYNKLLSDEILYQSREPVSKVDEGEQLKKIQKMRDEGLISEQQYESRKSKVRPNE